VRKSEIRTKCFCYFYSFQQKFNVCSALEQL